MSASASNSGSIPLTLAILARQLPPDALDVCTKLAAMLAKREVVLFLQSKKKVNREI